MLGMKLIFPPRPKSKMSPADLPYYESTGEWVAQRKFRGSNCVIYISKDRQITCGSRHGKPFARFDLNQNYCDEIISSLNLNDNLDYWFNGELMNKDINSTNEIILFDILQAGRYFFGNPNQHERLKLLYEICGQPQKLCETGIAFQVSDRLRLAEVFTKDFSARFEESLPNPQLEGLVLRKKGSALDNLGNFEYETANLLRCRKPFGCDTPKKGRSGGYVL